MKGSDNPYPSLLFEEHVDPVAPAAGHQRLFIDTDHHLKTIDSASSVTDWTAAAGNVATDTIWDAAGDLAVGSGANTAAKLAKGNDGEVLSMVSGAVDWAEQAGKLLGLKVYAPGDTTIYECTSETWADVDATNMAVTFTAPASGNVLVRLSAYTDYNDDNTSESFWGLRESTTNLPCATRVARGGESGYRSVPFYLSGISAGSHTYKWAYAVAAGSKNRIIIQDGTVATTEWGPAIIEVWSAP